VDESAEPDEPTGPPGPNVPPGPKGFRWRSLLAGVLAGGIVGYLLVQRPDALVIGAMFLAAYSQQRMIRQPQVAMVMSRGMIYLQGAAFLAFLGAITVVALSMPVAMAMVAPSGVGGVGREILLGLVLGLGAAVLITAGERLARIEETPLVRYFIPRERGEKALFVLLSLTATIGEELAFRGFLIDRLIEWTDLRGVAMAGSSLLFGLAHSYQGWSGVARTGAIGLALAALVWWRGDLMAAMVAHFVYDVVAGLYFANRDVPR